MKFNSTLELAKNPAKLFKSIATPIALMLWLLTWLLAPTYCYASNSSASAKKLIALTFDDGPSKQYTEEVLAILKEGGIKATFFVTGGSVSAHPQILREVFAAGHVIGNHTYSHPNLSMLEDSAIAKELNKNDALIYQTINVHPRLFRPPFGACNASCKKVVSNLGLKKITWDYMVDDWDIAKTTPEIIAGSVIKHASPGSIVNMHDGGGNREKTVAALPEIIAALKKEGYAFVTVPELLGVETYREE